MSVWRSLGYTLRNEGVASVIQKAAGRARRLISYRYESLLYLRRGLDIPEGSSDPGIEVRTMDFEDLVDAGYFKIEAYPERLIARFDRGDWCFGTFVDGTLGNVSWVSHDLCPIDFGLPDIRLKGGVGIYDCFTMPESRGRGAFSAAIGAMCRAAHEGGYDRALALIVQGNAPSRHVFSKSEFDVAGSLVYRSGIGGTRLEHPQL